LARVAQWQKKAMYLTIIANLKLHLRLKIDEGQIITHPDTVAAKIHLQKKFIHILTSF
jgi:hypothetical protein